MWIEVDAKSILFSRKMQNLCAAPFYGHSKGCPNFGKKEGCPPNQPLINNILDFDSKMYLIYTEFLVGEFAERMRQTHPGWVNHPRQWYNPRRWQPRARKFQCEEEKRFLKEVDDVRIIQSPEACGVNVTALMKSVGIVLNWQWPPKHNLKNKVYLVSLAGQPLRYYTYLGDKLTDERLKNKKCWAVLRRDGKCIKAKSKMFVEFPRYGKVVVLIRRLRRIGKIKS